MTCPTCGANNRDGAAFCRQCGRLLLSACPRCGSAATADANFCDTCGVPLSPRAWTGAWSAPAVSPAPRPTGPASTPAAEPPTVSLPSAPERENLALERFIPRELLSKMTAARGATSERRVVTMLFCDIQGSTALAEELDPEEWTEIVNAAFEQMVRPIYKYEGTVARLMGDGLLAFFGAPVAHEDDPRRAILAGLAIVDGIRAWRETLPAARDLDVRVGINTGLVVVGAVGSDLRLEYSAIGDAINLAARMEQTAAPGTVQIAEDTHRLVAGQFEVEPLGGVTVKGKAQPVAAYRVLRRAGSGARRTAATLRAPLVNRRMEWEALERAFDALGAGRGGLVFLTGDAGLGKTRLIDEAVERLLPVDSRSRLYETAAASYETTQPYALLTRLLRQPLGLMAGDPATLVREQLAATVPADDIPILETLFGVAPAANGHEPAGEEFARRLDEALDRFWRAQVEAGPLVVALDELQWLDASSADRLAALFQLTESAPILFLCALRRERRSPGWGLKETAGRDLPHRLTEVALHPLNDHESRLMLAELLGGGGARGMAELPDTLAALILEKAEGNPLFLEEVVRHLIERGDLTRNDSGAWSAAALGDVLLPDSLLALLTARIDRLDDGTRRALQAAAVIGRHFARSPLAALVDDPDALDRHLVELQRMELIREVSRVPEPIYSFNHSLTHEAVYNTILLKQRRVMHRRVAETLESLHAGSLGDVAPVLAYHFIEGEAPKRALPYLLAAASSALRLHATSEAIAHYERAMPIALTMPDNTDQLIEVFTKHGRALELQSRFQEADAGYDVLEKLALELGNQVLELEAVLAKGKLRASVTLFYDPTIGRAMMERAMTLAEATGNRVAEVRILWTLVNLDRFDVNALDNAIRNGERGISLARELGLDEELAYLLNDLGDIYGTAGHLDQAKELMDEAGARWRNLGNEPMLADSLTSTAVWNMIGGNLYQALTLAEESFAITSRIGNLWGQSYSQCIRGTVQCWLGENESGISDLITGIANARAAHFLGGELLANSFLARVLLLIGDIDGAIAYAEAGLVVGRESLPQFAGSCLGIIASAELARGNLDLALVAYNDPLASQENQQIFVIFDTLLAGIELALAQENPEEAIARAGKALNIVQSYGAGSWLVPIRHAQGKAFHAAGRLAEAAECMRDAIDRARSIHSRNSLWRVLGDAALVAEAMGDSESAAVLRAEAAVEIDFLAERIPAGDLRTKFLAHPDTARIIRLRLPK